ncbi:MAG: zf-HC2 domain-containing protein [Planctomycetes bacterium]|nr:zf-HC2 domain-containing protein [Planctomycetota bacterium]
MMRDDMKPRSDGPAPCEEMKPLLMGYLDGEIDSGDIERVRAHLAGCAACRAELEAFRRLVQETEGMRIREPGDDVVAAFWRSLYNQIERGTGWVLVIAGALLVLAYGAYELVRAPGMSVILKVGIASAAAGFVILLLSVLRERLKVARVDRYSKEIER